MPRKPVKPLQSLKRTWQQVTSSLKVSRLLFPALFLQAFCDRAYDAGGHLVRTLGAACHP
ncbi:hypothetical protein ACFTAO_18020 [Paenibacillus rhizoplanae]